eukprot:Nitzschia sp. Nitz4//scaffold676_size1792//391//1597//NITZ4_009313-RA/size1792-snap-gene-0.3-mRNA-1//1//CDS//3329556428//2229//frame0
MDPRKISLPQPISRLHRSVFDSQPKLYDDNPAVPSIDKVFETVSCNELMEKSYRHTAPINHSDLFLRYTDGDPRYWISLHSKEYDPVRWGIMEHGKYYEQALSNSFREILSNSTTGRPHVVDVGGNIGWYTLLAASLGSVVDTFEPNPENCLRICESLCLNRWEIPCKQLSPKLSDIISSASVRIHQAGVGLESGTALFDTKARRGNNPGGGQVVTLKHIPKVSEGKYTDISVVSLDEVALANGWYGHKIDILKVDVEGFELQVFSGTKILLQEHIIKNVFLEGDVSRPAMQKKFRDMSNILVMAGYRVYKIGGHTGPTNTFTPNPDAILEDELIKACLDHGGKSKKCNMWWNIPDSRFKSVL